jgi:hypothetical protein
MHWCRACEVTCAHGHEGAACSAGVVLCLMEHAYQCMPGQARMDLAFSAAEHPLQPAR